MPSLVKVSVGRPARLFWSKSISNEKGKRTDSFAFHFAQNIPPETPRAAQLSRRLKPPHLALGVACCDLCRFQLLIGVGELFPHQVQFFTIDLSLLFTLGELRVQLTVVVVEQLNATAEFGHSRIVRIERLGADRWIE